ncbi:MAG: ImmA/IrrE family metallo-endopeptidase [[Eubacterium] sulci]|nr:ImmA/IrrE family metallo-endopeptidase [[Eubacterium] sulci]
MNRYEELIAEYENELNIEEHSMINKGLYCDNIVWINRKMSTAEKLSIVAEEIGHYKTSSGNILDQDSIANIKQELQARRWAYEKVLPLDLVMQAITNGLTEVYDLAEHFDVTEMFMRECLKHYRLLDI